jgi:putative aldouronate transport system permease protein
MAILVFTFVDKWNEWYTTMLYIKDATKFPLTYVLKTIVSQITNSADLGITDAMKQKQVFPAGVQRATIIFTILPIMLVYPFVQKYFAEGIMLGSIKE